MKKMKLFNIDPLGFAKVYGFIMGIVGLLYGAMYACMIMFVSTAGKNLNYRNDMNFNFGMMNNFQQPQNINPGLALIIACCCIFLVPIVAGAIGFAIGYIEMIIVNKILTKVGGIELSFKD